MSIPKIISLQAEHVLPDGQINLLGATGSVTPTMTHVELGGARLLVDCGAKNRTRDQQMPKQAIHADALLLTHAHQDHVGGLPKLLQAGFDKPIFATQATLEIARVLLKDGIRINRGTHSDVRAFTTRFDNQLRPIRYNRRFEPVSSSKTTAVFHEAGHILGSASLEIASPRSRVIVSGDLGRPGSPILRDYNTTWDADRPVDLVLMETTYGNRIHDETPDDLEKQLENAIKKALLDGGHILVPSFAIGRTQVLLYLLNTLVESGRVKNLPVAVDTPMGLRVTDTYKNFHRLYDRDSLKRIADGDMPLEFEDLYSVQRHRESVRLRDTEQPMLIIAGSGMCTGGRIVGHLFELLPKPETCVIFVGHQAAGTPGRAIQDAASNRQPDESATVYLGGQQVSVNAEVQTLRGISAHADRNELGAWLDAIPNVKRVALHHGEEKSQKAFSKWYERQK